MSGDRFQVITSLTRADYRDLVRGLTRVVWPEFMLHDAVANKNWHELLDRFAEYQLALYDTENRRVAGMGNSFPLRWDERLEDLPDGGWDWAFAEAVKDHKQGAPPNFHCAIQIIVHPDYRGQGLSMRMVKAMSAIGKSKGFKNLVAPVRPNQKSQYPLTSIDDYITWKTDEGMPFDAWLRVHARAGAKIVKPCHEAMTIRGTRAEWESWTGLKFMQSSEYHIPGALNPMRMNVEKEEGVYIEPNVWMVHKI